MTHGLWSLFKDLLCLLNAALNKALNFVPAQNGAVDHVPTSQYALALDTAWG